MRQKNQRSKKSYEVSAMSYGRDAISDKLIWNSSDPSLASVDQVGTITTYEREGADGRLELDEEENVIGYPDLENIESIHSDVENILKNYPAVVKISHGKGRIAPHWAVTKFVPEVFFESVCCMQGIIPGSREYLFITSPFFLESIRQYVIMKRGCEKV